MSCERKQSEPEQQVENAVDDQIVETIVTPQPFRARGLLEEILNARGEVVLRPRGKMFKADSF